jgi:hypothetical protein
MNAEDQAKYCQARLMCEFMANMASVLEYSGGLNKGLRDRIEESVRPIREAQDWIWHIGQLIIGARPLPNGLHEALEIMDERAREAFPRFKALMDEACEELVRTAATPKPSSDGALVRQIDRP